MKKAAKPVTAHRRYGTLCLAICRHSHNDRESPQETRERQGRDRDWDEATFFAVRLTAEATRSSPSQLSALALNIDPLESFQATTPPLPIFRGKFHPHFALAAGAQAQQAFTGISPEQKCLPSSGLLRYYPEHTLPSTTPPLFLRALTSQTASPSLQCGWSEAGQI
jgi:hypothetical protein